MVEQIFEIKIVHKNNMPKNVRKKIISDVARRPESFQKNFKGFAKVIYVTASPKKISSVEAIEGTIIDYFESTKEEGVNIPTF